MLDSQCKFPKASDATFVQSLKDTLANHSRFGHNPRTPTDFIIKHYAGAVQYDSTGFLEKNKDTLSGGAGPAAAWLLMQECCCMAAAWPCARAALCVMANQLCNGPDGG